MQIMLYRSSKSEISGTGVGSRPNFGVWTSSDSVFRYVSWSHVRNTCSLDDLGCTDTIKGRVAIYQSIFYSASESEASQLAQLAHTYDLGIILLYLVYPYLTF